MATALKLKNDIKKLKAAISSKATPKSFVPKLKSQLEKAENELASMKKSGRPRKTSTTTGTQKTLTALQKLIQKKKFGVYQGAGVDLKKDAGEGALATGRRVSKGLKSNQWGDKSDNKGNVYYEYRPNRLDVKQPKKKQTYPKLADGGKVVGYKMYYEPQKDLGGKSVQSDDDIRGNYKAMDAVLDRKLGDNYLGSNFYIGDGYGKVLLKDEKSKQDVKRVLEMFDFEDATSKYQKKEGGYMAKGGEIGFNNSNLYLNGFGKDSNGNSVIKVSFPNDRAFSIQTNGVLQFAHEKRSYKISELTDSDINKIEKEVVEYVKEFGSKEQKQRLKTYSGYMAKGGETVPYIIWVSKDGEKREFYGDYKSQRAAEMAMKKLWDSSDYKAMGNKPKKMYEKEGLWAKGGYMADGGKIDFDYELIVQPDFKYKDTAKRWLSDNEKDSIAYKLAVLLIRGKKNPDEILGITDDSKYARLLRRLEKISGESKHEMAWRTENYNLAEAENWTRDSLNDVFYVHGSHNKMAEGGSIPEGYHQMPDGSIMADSAHMAKGGEINVKGKYIKLKYVKRCCPSIKNDGTIGNYQYDFVDEMGNPFIGYGNSKEEALKSIEEYQNSFASGGYMADGGEVGEGFYIRDMKQKLSKMFPDSFGFTVGNFSKEGDLFKNSSALIVDTNSPFNGLQDSEIKSKLFFPQYKRDHDIRFRIYQGGENTYFYFLLESENGDQYIGQFGFKDEGDVSSDYITRFIAFLMEQYGLPFEVKHSVMAKGGYMAGGGEMHKADYFKDGGKVFSEKELKGILDEALGHLYQGLNQVDLAMRYLEVKGQGGLKTPLSNKLKLDDLKESIEKIEEYTSK